MKFDINTHILIISLLSDSKSMRPAPELTDEDHFPSLGGAGRGMYNRFVLYKLTKLNIF